MTRHLIVSLCLFALASCAVAPPMETVVATSNSSSDISRFENRLAEKLLHLAFQEIKRADEIDLTKIIEIHQSKIERAVDVTRLSGHNQLQVRLLDELLLSNQDAKLSPEAKINRHVMGSTLGLDAATMANLARARLIHLQNKIALLKGMDKASALTSLFDELRDNDDNYQPETEDGRQQYLTLIVDKLVEIDSLLPMFINTRSHKELNLMGFNNKGSVTARVFNYDQATATLEVDLTDMKQLPLFETESTALFYGVPGLHTIASAHDRFEIQSLMGLETYRSGWATYTITRLDRIPLYQHPNRVLERSYSELLYLAMAIVDYSISTQKYTDDEATRFLLENSPYPVSRIKRSIRLVHRDPGFYFGQYLGLLEFEALRKNAEESLNENFDPVEFHKYIVELGPLPFTELRVLVKHWVDKKS